MAAVVTPRLTDDEVVAIMAARGKPYVGPLPTVDSGSSTELLRAVYRGNRSLVLRDLIDDGGEPHPPLAAITTAMGGDAGRLIVYVGSRSLERTLSDVNFVYYATEAGCLIEGISATGVHDYVVVSSERGSALLRELVVGAQAESPTDRSDRVGLVVLRVIGGNTEAIFSREGELVTGSPDAEGRVDTWSPLPLEGVDMWLKVGFASGLSYPDRHDG